MKRRGMSNAELEERVVSMRFDNTQFKAASRETLAALNELDKSVSSLGSSNQNISSISDAIAAIGKHGDLSSISKNVDDIADHFTWFGRTIDRVADTATSKVFGMASGMVSSLKGLTTEFLGFDPGLGGFHEYEEMMNSIQTISTNTASKGTTLDEINETLAELNDYADQTIYNFQAMTKNIGTFTAAGIELQDATDAIKGIANLGAGVGSTPQQVANAMYQLSQALAAGKVSLQDWNSVVNAGMGGEYFQNALKQTARDIAHAKGIAVEEFEGTFRESISGQNGTGWLTSEVLLETLKKFANDPDLLKAATRVRTWNMLIDTMKESIGSGWTTSWQYFIGDLDEAADLFTMLADAFNDVITPIHDARNELLKFWHDNGGRTSMIRALTNVIDAFALRLSTIGDAWRAVFPPLSGEQFIEATNRVEAFTESLIPSEEELDKLYSISVIFFSTLRSIVDVLKTIINFVGQAIDLVWIPFSSVLSFILTLFASLGDRVREFLAPLDILHDRVTDFGGVFAPIIDLFYILIDLLSAAKDLFILLGVAIYNMLDDLGLGDIVRWVQKAASEVRTFVSELTVTDVISGWNFLVNKVIGFYNTLKDKFPVLQTIEDFFTSNNTLIGDFGEKVKESGGIFKYIFAQFTAFREWLSSKVEWATGLLFKKDVKEVADETQTAFERLDGVFKWVATTWDFVVSGLADGAGTLRKYFGPIIEQAILDVKSFLEKATDMDLQDLITLVSIFEGVMLFRAIKNAFTGASKILKSTSEFIDAGAKLVKKIEGFFGSLSGVLNAFKFTIYGDVFIKFAVAIGVLTAALIALSLVDTNKGAAALPALIGIVAEMAVLMVGMSVLNKVGFKFDTTPILMLSLAMGVIAAMIYKLSEIDDVAKVHEIVGDILLLIVTLGLIPTALATINGITKGGQFKGSMLGMLAFIGSLYMTIGLVRKLAADESTDFEKGLARLTGILVSFGLFFLMAQNIGKMSLVAAIGMTGIAKAIDQLAYIAGELAVINDEVGVGNLWHGIGQLALLIVEIGGILAGLALISKKWTGAKSMVVAAASFVVVAAGLAMIINSLKVLADVNVSVDKITAVAQALSSLAIVAAALAATIAYFSKSKGSNSTTSIASSISIFGNASAFATNILLVSTAFLALAAALKKLSELSMSQLGKGAAIFAIFVASTMALGALAKTPIFDSFGDGILKTAKAIAILTLSLMGLGVLLAAGGPLLAIIAAGANSIVEYLTTIGIAILALIVSLAEPLVEAAYILLMDFVDGLSAHMDDFVSSIGRLLNSVLYAVAGSTVDNFFAAIIHFFKTYAKRQKLKGLDKEIAKSTAMIGISPAGIPEQRITRLQKEKDQLTRELAIADEAYEAVKKSNEQAWIDLNKDVTPQSNRAAEFLQKYGKELEDAEDSSISTIDDVKGAIFDLIKEGLPTEQFDITTFLGDPSEIGTQATSWMNGIWSQTDMGTIGEGTGNDLIAGIIGALKSGESDLSTASSEDIKAILNSMMETGEIHSPSKKTEHIAEMMVLGMTDYFKASIIPLYAHGMQMALSVFSGMKDVIDSELPNSLTDMPTDIVPIMDLSKIQNDINTVNAILPNHAMTIDTTSTMAEQVSISMDAYRADTSALRESITALSLTIQEQQDELDDIHGLLDQYLPYLPKLSQMKLVTDTGALVGEMVEQIDDSLADRYTMSVRSGRA